MLHELSVRGLLIALRRARDREAESKEGGCGRLGCKSPKENAFHDDASSAGLLVRDSPDESLVEAERLPKADRAPVFSSKSAGECRDASSGRL